MFALFNRVPYEGDYFLGIYTSIEEAKKGLLLSKLPKRYECFIVELNENQPAMSHYAHDWRNLYEYD